MNNLLDSAKRFFKNKNTVTIIGVIVILVLLYLGYSSQIRNAVSPVTVPIASQTIQPRTKITDDMIQTIDMPNISISDNVFTSKQQVVDKYSNINTVIPKGSMFYREAIIDEKDLPNLALMSIKEGDVVYSFPVDMENTYGNSILPGSKIDIYMKVGDGTDEKIMIGKLLSNVEVLAVKDASGRPVFENTDEERTPSMMLFGLSEKLWLLLSKASYLRTQGVELFPVPLSESGTSNVKTTVSTQQLVDYINSHSVDIPVDEPEETTDKLIPSISSVTSVPANVVVKYPEGCGSTYTCSYSKDGGNAVAVTKTSVTIKFDKAGTLTVNVTEKDGTAHNATVNIPTNSTDNNTGNNG